MGKKDKIYMPSGMGGLVRYGEGGKQKYKLKPKHLVYLVSGIVIIELVLKAMTL